MAFSDELTALKSDLELAKVPVDAVLARAGANRSTWTRWGNGSTKSPHYETWQNVQTAARTLIAEAEQPV